MVLTRLEEPSSTDSLLSMLTGKLKSNQVSSISQFAKENFEPVINCMLDGRTLEGILHVLKEKFSDLPFKKYMYSHQYLE